MHTYKIEAELKAHIIAVLNDFIGMEKADLHNEIFNSDYYIVGYYQAEQLLVSWLVSAFEAIEYVQDYEKDISEETHTTINSEAIVNMLVYIVGEELLQDAFNDSGVDTDGELTEEDIKELCEALED
jgi:hypothetical protein